MRGGANIVAGIEIARLKVKLTVTEGDPSPVKARHSRRSC